MGERVWPSLVLALLFTGWVIGTPVLLLNVAFSMPFMGGATDADFAEREYWQTWATAVGIGVPFVGVVVAGVFRRKVGGVVFGIALLLSLGVVAYDRVDDVRKNPPARERGPYYCQEHSGGDSTCPGG